MHVRASCSCHENDRHSQVRTINIDEIASIILSIFPVSLNPSVNRQLDSAAVPHPTERVDKQVVAMFYCTEIREYMKKGKEEIAYIRIKLIVAFVVRVQKKHLRQLAFPINDVHPYSTGFYVLLNYFQLNRKCWFHLMMRFCVDLECFKWNNYH